MYAYIAYVCDRSDDKTTFKRDAVIVGADEAVADVNSGAAYDVDPIPVEFPAYHVDPFYRDPICASDAQIPAGAVNHGNVADF